MKTLPKSQKYNILDDWNNRVSKLSHDYQINWLRFEYVRRNEEYKKDWKDFLKIPGVVQIKNSLFGWKHSSGEYLQRASELSRKWEIIYFGDPFRPLRECKISKVEYPEPNKPFIFKEWKDCEPTTIIQPLTFKSFQNLPTQEQKERQFFITAFHSLESFEIWRTTTQSGKEIMEWDESTWQLIAINRRVGREEVIKEFKKLIKKIPRKMTQKRIEQNVYYLRVWDLKVKNEQGHDIYSNEDIAEDVNLKTNSALNRTKILSKWGKKAEELINGGYRKIR